jgi:hypothetical protein
MDDNHLFQSAEQVMNLTRQQDSQVFQRMDSDIQRGIELNLRQDSQTSFDDNLFKEKDSLVLFTESRHEVAEVMKC